MQTEGNGSGVWSLSLLPRLSLQIPSEAGDHLATGHSKEHGDLPACLSRTTAEPGFPS